MREFYNHERPHQALAYQSPEGRLFSQGVSRGRCWHNQLTEVHLNTAAPSALRSLGGAALRYEEQRKKAQVEPFRKYGGDPFRVVVIHGGPGAVGSVAPIARALGQTRGVVEPLQTATTLDGQMEELRLVVEQNATPPEQEEYLQLVDLLDRPATAASAVSLSRLGELTHKADSYDPIAIPNDTADLDDIANPAEMYQGVWPQAAQLRATGELLRRVATITCPVGAIHGDCDPHPAEGIQQPLAANVQDFRMIILEQCGHTPWGERRARERFFEILEHELSTAH